MRFADPIWLFAGAACVTVLVVLLARAEVLRTRALTLLAGSRLALQSFSAVAMPSKLRRWFRVGVISLAVAMGFLALARPQKGLRWETVDRKGTDLLLVVDTSRSMDADDVKPTRLERSKLAIHDLVEKFPGDRIGLVAFAGDAFVQSPMTLDHEALLETVDALDTSIVARGGTNIGRAIDVAGAALATEPDHDKTMVLVTDGEDLEGQGLEEAKKAARAGIVIDTVGVGSSAGELVPHKDERGNATGVVRDADGKPVRSRLDETTLQSIAGVSNGTYRPLGVDGSGLLHLYTDVLAPRAHVEASTRSHRVYGEWFEVPLALLLGGIVLDGLLGLALRRRRSPRNLRRVGPGRARASAAAAAAVAASLVVFGAPRLAHASSVADAQKAYAAGHFEEAEKQYVAESDKHPKDAALAFNAGDAAYKAGHFDAAKAAFKRAVAVADPALQQHVLYNQGDVLYRTGEHIAADTALAEKKEAWKAAIAAYDGALALSPKDADARFNRDFVKRRLAELEKKEEEQKKKDESAQQQQQSKNGDDDKKAKSDSKGGNGNPQGNEPNGKDQKRQNGNDKKPGDKQQPGQDGQPNQDPTPPPQMQPPESGGKNPTDDHKAPGAKLSEGEARALLAGRKGDERHAVLRASASDSGDAGAPDDDDDAPRKDW